MRHPRRHFERPSDLLERHIERATLQVGHHVRVRRRLRRRRTDGVDVRRRRTLEWTTTEMRSGDLWLIS